MDAWASWRDGRQSQPQAPTARQPQGACGPAGGRANDPWWGTPPPSGVNRRTGGRTITLLVGTGLQAHGAPVRQQVVDREVAVEADPMGMDLQIMDLQTMDLRTMDRRITGRRTTLGGTARILPTRGYREATGVEEVEVAEAAATGM